MTKLFSALLIFGFVSLFPIGKVFADTSCQPVYGGGQTCVTTGNILVHKMVDNPANPGQFVDNLGINDPKFSPGQDITFNIDLTNTGATTFLQTSLKDVLPPQVIFVSSTPNGTFDQNSRTVTFIVDNLKANETRTNFRIQGKIVDASQIAQDLTCDPVNVAITTTNTGQTSTSQSRFCIQKGAVTKGGLPVFPPPKVITTPSTGPELIPLIGLLPAGLSGWFLRRKSGGKR